MASDAKIGLLLGLVFIFIIALVINGLPSFHESGNNNELTTKMVRSQNNLPAIAAKERGVINMRESVEQKPAQVELPSAGNQDIIPAMTAAENTSIIKETAAEQAIAVAAQAVAAIDESPKAESDETLLSKIYVVSKGDSLASIARKFYGSRQGNKLINITRIFKANRKQLKSPDELSVGQKLVIPPLVASAPDKDRIVNVLSGTEFTKVESIGDRHLLANSSPAEQNSSYVVREGDSLWQIAADQLGSGSRCSEIAELNAGVLDSEDNLFVGMNLKLPAR
ncbi:MAG: LysM peptidoglycan-binding domain-containing protein [Phycisphaerae bacterium]|nr:LysM peptidoglycan-binding domain-containing protein [Phycisphaerae bacterium]MDD5381568.1 LysM peptidoglycan-binding domain-containing protein [Phycisphaerae bacterium]